jgi:hypothetical protein
MSRKRKFEDELMIATTAILVSVAAVVPEPPIPKHVSILTGKDYFQELLDSENEISFRDSARNEISFQACFLKPFSVPLFDAAYSTSTNTKVFVASSVQVALML